jgi:hypothetical protein
MRRRRHICLVKWAVYSFYKISLENGFETEFEVVPLVEFGRDVFFEFFITDHFSFLNEFSLFYQSW